MLQAIYAVDAAADLTSFAPPDGNIFWANGMSSRDDIQPLVYEYSASSMATPDGDNVIKPSSVSIGNPGRFLKRKLEYASFLNLPSLATVATSGDYSDLSGKPTLATVSSSGSYTDLINTPAGLSASTPSRALNSAAYQISSTRNSMVMYSIQISATISLVTGQSGTVLLQTSPTSGGTYTTIATLTNGNTGTLTIGLNLTQTQSAVLSGFVPAGYFTKLVSSGTATNSIVSQQEVVF